VKRFLSLLVIVALSAVLLVASRPALVADVLDQITGDSGEITYVDPEISGTGSRSLIALPEDRADAILGELEAAESSIDLYVYLLPSDEVLEELTSAHNRGVEVRVILEPDPFGGGNSNQEAFDHLDGIGIEVRWAPDEFTFSHVKSVVVDDHVALIMTLNLSYTALTTNREFAVLTTVPSDVQEVSRLFEADWAGDAYSPESPIVTSPDNSRAVMEELIESAGSSIWIYAEVVRDREIRNELIAAAEDGIAVRLLVPTSPAEDDLMIYRELEAAGAEVRYLAGAYSHAKAILVDGERLFIGSQNLTMTSLDENRECGIVLTEAAPIARLIAIFETDWSISESVR
jgi:phosphatidylserine/phosphatidylglycerophosphate/cardiolipin synthase-like enzyme